MKKEVQKNDQNTMILAFGNERIVISDIAERLTDLYGWDGDFKRYADAISNVFSVLLCSTDISLVEALRDDCNALDTLRLFFLDLQKSMMKISSSEKTDVRVSV